MPVFRTLSADLGNMVQIYLPCPIGAGPYYCSMCIKVSFDRTLSYPWRSLRHLPELELHGGSRLEALRAVHPKWIHLY